MEKDNIHDEVRYLIAKNEIDNALNALEKYAESNNNSRILDTITILKRNYRLITEKRRNGTIKHDEETRAGNEISIRILEISRELEINEKTGPTRQNEEKAVPFTEDDIFRISKTAVITIEVEKIKEEFYGHGWNLKADVLDKLSKFSSHTTPRLSKEIFSFLSGISLLPKHPQNQDLAMTIGSLINEFFPYIEKGKEGNEFLEIASQCVDIGFALFYDSAIHLNDLSVGAQGLLILKTMYWEGKEKESKFLLSKVIRTFDELEETLGRPERNDLGPAKEILHVFKDDLENKGLRYPIMPDRLFELVWRWG